jgi:predicted RND superfamily exporter protein
MKLFKHIQDRYPSVDVIGVHTPNFDFEKEDRNLEKNVRDLEIKHPIAQDTDRDIIQKYNLSHSNQVLIIEDGRIIHKHTGKAEESLLSKLSEKTGQQEEKVDLEKEILSQKFFGFSRGSGLNEEGNHHGIKDYELPKNRSKDKIYLEGKWEQEKDYIEAKQNSEIRFSLNSNELDLTVNPNDGLRDIEIYVDGKPLDKEQAGDDVRIEEDRSYLRVKKPGIFNLTKSKVESSEVTLSVDDKTRLYAISYR